LATRPGTYNEGGADRFSSILQEQSALNSLFQLDFSGASYDKGPRIDGSGSLEEADASALIPTEDEEERMARFWALEEANAPKGWEDDKEIDYEELAEKAAEMSKGQKSVSQEPPSEFYTLTMNAAMLQSFYILASLVWLGCFTVLNLCKHVLADVREVLKF